MPSNEWLEPYMKNGFKCGCGSTDLFLDGESMYIDNDSLVIEVTCNKCKTYYGLRLKPIETIIFDDD